MLSQEIRSLTQKLLETHRTPQEVEQLIQQIHDLFAQLTGISGYQSQNFQHMAAVPTAKGMALGLSHAAQCLLDYRRTLGFLRGITQAIHEQQDQHPGQPIPIFYAGCGPFAPWVTLIAPLYTPAEVQFTVLEINPESLRIAQNLIEALGLADYVAGYHQADAITFAVPEAEKYQLLISETLDAQLYRESYVAILWNLLPQFPETTTLLPHNVVISLSAHPIASEGESEILLGPVLDTRAVLAALPAGAELPPQLPSAKFPLPPEPTYQALTIDTTVHIHQDERLERGASSLTLPFQLPLDPRVKHLEFVYQTQPQMELSLNFS